MRWCGKSLLKRFCVRNPSDINALYCIWCSVIFAQSGEALSSETDPVQAHFFLLSFFIY